MQPPFYTNIYTPVAGEKIDPLKLNDELNRMAQKFNVSDEAISGRANYQFWLNTSAAPNTQRRVIHDASERAWPVYVPVPVQKGFGFDDNLVSFTPALSNVTHQQVSVGAGTAWWSGETRTDFGVLPKAWRFSVSYMPGAADVTIYGRGATTYASANAIIFRDDGYTLADNDDEGLHIFSGAPDDEDTATAYANLPQILRANAYHTVD